MIHDRNEPLCEGGYHRLHLMCGESLCSELASYLKLGTTALVARLSEAKRLEGAGLALAKPIDALRSFARDTSLRARARLDDGREWSALEIQRGYLERVEEHLDESFMPAWAPAVSPAPAAAMAELAASASGKPPSLRPSTFRLPAARPICDVKILIAFDSARMASADAPWSASTRWP